MFPARISPLTEGGPRQPPLHLGGGEGSLREPQGVLRSRDLVWLGDSGVGNQVERLWFRIDSGWADFPAVAVWYCLVFPWPDPCDDRGQVPQPQGAFGTRIWRRRWSCSSHRLEHRNGYWRRGWDRRLISDLITPLSPPSASKQGGIFYFKYGLLHIILKHFIFLLSILG